MTLVHWPFMGGLSWYTARTSLRGLLPRLVLQTCQLAKSQAFRARLTHFRLTHAFPLAKILSHSFYCEVTLILHAISLNI